MLTTPAITLLLATLAAALPSKRQSQPNLTLTLTNSTIGATEVILASTDGTPVVVDSDVPFNFVNVKCIEMCVPEYHCVLNFKNGFPALTVGPGDMGIAPGVQVGSIICGPGLPDWQTEPQAAATTEIGSMEP